MFYIILLIFLIAICYKWGDWRNWQKYQSTILFFTLGDFLYMGLTYLKPLWDYDTNFAKGIYDNLFVNFTIFPCTILLFIPRFPEGIKKQVLYILKWVVIYTSVEWLATLLHSFQQENGWTIWYSLTFNFVMFPLLWLHYKKPLLAYLGSFVVAVTILWLFKIPVNDIW